MHEFRCETESAERRAHICGAPHANALRFHSMYNVNKCLQSQRVHILAAQTDNIIRSERGSMNHTQIYLLLCRRSIYAITVCISRHHIIHSLALITSEYEFRVCIRWTNMFQQEKGKEIGLQVIADLQNRNIGEMALSIFVVLAWYTFSH